MDSSIFQSPEWEKFKLETGYQKSHRVSDILVLQKNLPFGRSMLYSPMVNKLQVASCKLREFIEQITKIGKENNSIFYRLELNIPKELETSNSKLVTRNFIKSFEEMQPENNWLLNIEKSEEELLSEMKQKGRYNLKIAKENGVYVTSSSEKGKELDAFYVQYELTGKRHKISYRSKNYFERLLEILGQKGYARAYAAWIKKDGREIPLASAIIVSYDTSMLYLYGGSGEEYRNLMAPYLLHWEIILDAKKQNLKEYNFLGIAPNDDPNHPWAGITRFKKQFGGYQTDILGSFDLPLKPLEYKIFKLAEKIRR